MGRHKKVIEELVDSNIDILEQSEESISVTEVLDTPVNQRGQQLVEELENHNQIRVLDRYYDKLFSTGVLISIHISRWSMSTSLKESDLEIEKVPDIIKLGKKMLVKPVLFNQFAQIEQRARLYLKRMSNRFPIAEAHFVAFHNLEEVRKQLETYKEEFNILVDSFVENYEQYKTEALAAYPEYADVLRPAYPSVNEIRGKFNFEYSEFRINMPNELQEVNIRVLLEEEAQVAATVNEAKEHYNQQAAKQLEQITNFVDNSIKELRESVNSVFAVIINKINKGDVVSDVNKNTLLKKIQDFEKLNIFGDKVLEERITEVQTFLAENRDLKSKDNVDDRNALKEFLLDVKTVAENTSDISSITGEYLRALEI